MFSCHSVREAKVELLGRVAAPGGTEEIYLSQASRRQVHPTWVNYRRIVTSVEMHLTGRASQATYQAV